jgi:hypothetical protein
MLMRSPARVWPRSTRAYGPVYMRPANEVKPGPFRFGHSIIYNRCLHSACRTEPTDFRPAWIQTGMNVNTNTFQTGLGCNFNIGTTHTNKRGI